MIDLENQEQWSFRWIEQEFTEFSEFEETDKSLNHELGSV